MTKNRSILWVFAHPDPQSLNAYLFREVTGRLRAQGSDVVTSDLYAMQWNPLITDSDFRDVDGATLSDRQKAATLGQTLAADIADEQEKLRAADTVVLQFPLWWYGMPAALKGWVDRVFTNGFAFGRTDELGHVRKYGDGGLAGRDFLAVVTAGDLPKSLGRRGISGSDGELMWPVNHGLAHYTGMRPRPPHLIADTHRVDSARAANEVAALVRRVESLPQEPPIAYRTLSGGDYENYELRESVAPDLEGYAAHMAR